MLLYLVVTAASFSVVRHHRTSSSSSSSSSCSSITSTQLFAKKRQNEMRNRFCTNLVARTAIACFTTLLGGRMGIFLPPAHAALPNDEVPMVQERSYDAVGSDYYEDEGMDEYYEEEEEEEVGGSLSSEEESTVSTLEKENTEEKDPLAAFGAVTATKNVVNVKESKGSKTGSPNFSPDAAFKQFGVPVAFAGAVGYMVKFHINEDKGVEEAIAMFEKERAEFYNITTVDDENDENNVINSTDALNGSSDDNEDSIDDEVQTSSEIEVRDNPGNDPEMKKPFAKKKLPPIDDIVKDSIADKAVNKSAEESSSKDDDIENERERLKKMFGS